MTLVKNVRKIIKSLGPGMIITASFIGPGTVTTMTQGGAGFGYSLLWAVATIENTTAHNRL